jgi:hypothetical protein
MVGSNQSPELDPTQVFDGLLAKYVIVGADGVSRVRYRAWRDTPEDMATLRSYIRAMEAACPSQMSASSAVAFWSNLYNAVTLEIVLDNYPVRSIRDIRTPDVSPDGAHGPWKMDRVTVEERVLSLHAIEHDILRARFHDPRIHYAINCASVSCPNLPSRAWRPDALDQALDNAARSYINHARGVRLLPSGEIEASRIFQWYGADFGESDTSVLAHQAKYADGPLSEALARAGKITACDYDWSLNDAEE